MHDNQTPDYNFLMQKLNIGYKTATGRFYKLRKQFGDLDQSEGPAQNEDSGEPSDKPKTPIKHEVKAKDDAEVEVEDEPEVKVEDEPEVKTEDEAEDNFVDVSTPKPTEEELDYA